ncbi:LysR family transcriptional regulator [Actinomadura sp. HBU206391]|uniref:LysR family transcriptional regulator n=1 Tax=Actinomadura sp. HBU206391 TaxID=2731692 RepID=UPI00164EE2A3|nr:LysR family transcriptional regulator [Actinomadura sp. HBU206391]MBC6458826.1 LysR family transcriptional regulator [Actinomadura sp. HBU206391]
MDDFEVRELRYFVAVAEELNFSRAAERLGMAQPPLSRAIRQMERRLGADLFERDTRRVALTSTGATLLGEARHALDVMAGLSRRTRRAALPRQTLVATAKPGMAAGMLRRIVDAYTALPGAAQVEIIVSAYRQQAEMVRDGRADVALLSVPFDRRGLDAEPLTLEPRVAALPRDHELALRPELHCRDLTGLPMPQWPEASLAERLHATGRDARVVLGTVAGPDDVPAGPVVLDSAQLLEVVSLGQAVALIPRFLATDNPRPDIAYRPVIDASPYTIAIAWPEGASAPAIALFVRTAMDVAEREPSVGRPATAEDVVFAS